MGHLAEAVHHSEDHSVATGWRQACDKDQGDMGLWAMKDWKWLAGGLLAHDSKTYADNKWGSL